MTAKIYRGSAVNVVFDASRCIHAAECIRGAPAVFDKSARPWIAPDNAGVEHLRDVVTRCPTGALTLQDAVGHTLEAAPARNTATVAARGPLYLRGRITLPGGTHASVVEYTRVALCRCGTSANKPFCDGSHVRIGFDDPGVCPNAPAAAAAADAAPGPLKVSVTADGPLMVEGCVEFRAADGAAFVTEKVWLCRCGHSRNKPFCDGSHRTAGFRG